MGASPLARLRDVWLPSLAPALPGCGAMVFATAMGAFGTAFTLASKIEVLPLAIYNEFTNYANFACRGALHRAGPESPGSPWRSRAVLADPRRSAAHEDAAIRARTLAGRAHRGHGRVHDRADPAVGRHGFMANYGTGALPPASRLRWFGEVW
jgi:hypothetical protein